MSNTHANLAVIHFACQRCMTPIKVDSSFCSIDEHTLAELRRKCSIHSDFYIP